MYRLGRRLMEISRAAASDPDDPEVSLGEMVVLEDVLAYPGSSVGEIASRTGFAQSYVSVTVATFKSSGAFETAADPADGRRTLVRGERASFGWGLRRTRGAQRRRGRGRGAGRSRDGGEGCAAARRTGPVAPFRRPPGRLIHKARRRGRMRMERRESLTGVGKTALGVAALRARESQRPDRLFDDAYAQAFMDAAPGAFPEEPTTTGEISSLGPLASLGAAFYFHGIIRTRFFDDYLLAAGASGCTQVVLLAAGLDTRAFRLAWPEGVRLFELDLPEVLAFKDRVLAGQSAQPRCERTVVPVDLREDWAARLSEAGFQPGEPTAWLAEGLLLYLSADEAASLFTAVGQLSAPGSQLSFEHGADAALFAQARAMPSMNRYTALWKGGLGEDAPNWLTQHRWRTRVHEFTDIAASYGRPVPDSSSGGFLIAVRERR